MVDHSIKVLEHSLAELSIQDVFRNTTRLPLPPQHLLVQFNMIAKNVMCKMSRSFPNHKRDITCFFGAPTIVIAKLWELILANNDGDEDKISNKEHLLWALHYMKQSPNFEVMCKTMKKDSKEKCPAKGTLVKWVWFRDSINVILSYLDSEVTRRSLKIRNRFESWKQTPVDIQSLVIKKRAVLNQAGSKVNQAGSKVEF